MFSCSCGSGSCGSIRSIVIVVLAVVSILLMIALTRKNTSLIKHQYICVSIKVFGATREGSWLILM